MRFQHLAAAIKGALLAGLLALFGGSAWAQAIDGATAQGLIVRLKAAAVHEIDSRGENPRPGRRHPDTERWNAVLDGAALTKRSGQIEPQRRPVGRDQFLLDFGRGLSADEAARVMQRLKRRAEVDWVAPNVREKRLQVPTDPLYAQQWWLHPNAGSNANAIEDRLRGVAGFLSAWQSGVPGAVGGPAALVAVLDTGITQHPELIGRTAPGYDFVSDTLFANDGNGRDADPSDPGDWVSASDKANSGFSGCDEQKSSWHGTIIAGLIAASSDNGAGVAGINRNGRILPVRVAGKCGATVADIVDGMRWAAGLAVDGVPVNPNPARIINISFGGSAACGPEYQSAIDELRARGAVVVAAAGNEFGAVSRPASCTGVVGVAAVNRDGFKTHYSNFGAALSASGLATVGGDDNRGGLWRHLLADNGLITVWNNGLQGPGDPEYAALFGTSFAAPLVAGTMSLMLSVNPVLTASQLIAGVRLSVRPHVISPPGTSPGIAACSEANPGRCICSTATCGAGLLDAQQALVYALNPEAYVPPARQGAVIDNIEVSRAVALGPDRVGTSPPAPPPTPAPAPTASSGGGAVGHLALGLLGLAVLGLRRRK